MTRTHRHRALPAIIALSIALPAAALASSPAEQGAKEESGKTAHYEVPLPATKEEAVTLLKTNLAKIETGLTASQFEAIHEATYGVESAIARLAQEPGYDGLKTAVAPRVEIVHLASEQGDADTLKAAVPILTKAVNTNLQALLN